MASVEEIARIAALVGEPTRTRILLALGDGRALPAGELAAYADVTAPTASGHLTQLVMAGLLTVVRQGRHRYYRLASGHVAALLESVMVVAATSPHPRVSSRVDPALQQGRTCYNHLAGRLGVAICDALVRTHRVVLDDEGAHVTPDGLIFLDSMGIPIEGIRRQPYSRTCIDWSERRPHLAGTVGIAIHKRCLELKWISPHLDSRAVRVTGIGKKQFLSQFGIDTTSTP